VNKFVLRERDSGQYVDRWGRLHSEPAQAYVFLSVEEAEAYRLRKPKSPDGYELSALSADGEAIATRQPARRFKSRTIS
jgi:hypothetical protein